MPKVNKDEIDFLSDTFVNCQEEDYGKAHLILKRMTKEELILFIEKDIIEGIACHIEEIYFTLK